MIIVKCGRNRGLSAKAADLVSHLKNNYYKKNFHFADFLIETRIENINKVGAFMTFVGLEDHFNLLFSSLNK